MRRGLGRRSVSASTSPGDLHTRGCMQVDCPWTGLASARAPPTHLHSTGGGGGGGGGGSRRVLFDCTGRKVPKTRLWAFAGRPRWRSSPRRYAERQKHAPHQDSKRGTAPPRAARAGLPEWGARQFGAGNGAAAAKWPQAGTGKERTPGRGPKGKTGRPPVRRWKRGAPKGKGGRPREVTRGPPPDNSTTGTRRTPKSPADTAGGRAAGSRGSRRARTHGTGTHRPAPRRRDGTRDTGDPTGTRAYPTETPRHTDTTRQRRPAPSPRLAPGPTRPVAPTRAARPRAAAA